MANASGRFIEHKRKDDLVDYECSWCGHVFEDEYNQDCDKWNYCPICGCCFIDWEELSE